MVALSPSSSLVLCAKAFRWALVRVRENVEEDQRVMGTSGVSLTNFAETVRWLRAPSKEIVAPTLEYTVGNLRSGTARGKAQGYLVRTGGGG